MPLKIIPKFCTSHRCLDDVKNDVYRDDTEATNGSDFDDCYDALDGEMSKVTVSTSDTLEESLESSFMELQHEMREKTSQCTILRETLTTMSATMRRLEFQLKEKVTELEEKMSSYEQKTNECEHWKSLYEALESKIENETSKSEVQPIVSTIVNQFLLAQYNYESYTNRRPWRSSKNGDNDGWDDLSASSDSIDEQYGSDLDDLYEYKNKKVSKRLAKSKQNKKKLMEPKEYVITQEVSMDTEPGRTRGNTNEQIQTTEQNLFAPETILQEVNHISDSNYPTSKHKSSDIEYIPVEPSVPEDDEQNAIDDLLNSSWGNIEHCLSEEDPLYKPHGQDFMVAAVSNSCVLNESETASINGANTICIKNNNYTNSSVNLVDEERRARRLQRRVIRTAKRAARKAQFQCEVVEC